MNRRERCRSLRPPDQQQAGTQGRAARRGGDGAAQRPRAPWRGADAQLSEGEEKEVGEMSGVELGHRRPRTYGPENWPIAIADG